jgi:hypothetical protein
MFTHELELSDASMAIIRRAVECHNRLNAGVPDFEPIDEIGWIKIRAAEVIKSEHRRQINEDADISRIEALKAAGLE